MTASEPGRHAPAQGDTDTDTGSGAGARSGAGGRRPLGTTPIVWKWWLLAALISLGLWAGIAVLVW